MMSSDYHAFFVFIAVRGIAEHRKSMASVHGCWIGSRGASPLGFAQYKGKFGRLGSALNNLQA
jgi:hypothetical protein